MKIAFVWTGFTSYMADCWRRLAAEGDVELKIWVEQVREGNIAFQPDSLMRGLDFQWRYSDKIGKTECRIAEDEIAEFQPAVVFICGWARTWPPYLARSRKLASMPKILCCDMPWEWKPRKFAARFYLWRHLRRFRKIMVPGRRAAMYARWLGFRGNDIVLGEYAIDTNRFSHATQMMTADCRCSRRFVFVGRLVNDKNIAMLVRAYSRYRELASMKRWSDIWPLDIYGQGEFEALLHGLEGVTVHGFAQPVEVPKIYAQAGAFVLASKWDPWPLVILEACVAGLPVICTENCWNRYELIRENGIVVPSNDPEAMAQAMLEISLEKNLKGRGEIGQALAAPYSCENWVKRIIALTRGLNEK